MGRTRRAISAATASRMPSAIVPRPWLSSSASTSERTASQMRRNSRMPTTSSSHWLSEPKPENIRFWKAAAMRPMMAIFRSSSPVNSR